MNIIPQIPTENDVLAAITEISPKERASAPLWVELALNTIAQTFLLRSNKAQSQIEAISEANNAFIYSFYLGVMAERKGWDVEIRGISEYE